MSRTIMVDGVAHQFPDDATDDEISQALNPAPPTLGQQASGLLGAGHRRVGQALNYIDTLGGRMTAAQKAAPTSRGFIAAPDVNPVPANLTQGGVAAGVQLGASLAPPGAGPAVQALYRLGLGHVLGGAGMAAEGKNPVSMEGVKTITAPLVAGEVAGYAIPRAARMFPGVKSALSEQAAQEHLGTMRDIDPNIAATVEAQQVKPTLKGGTTAAKLRQAATGGDLQTAASREMDQAITTIDQLSGSPKINTANMQQAYASMPQLAKDKLVGAVDPAGFTLRQAQEIAGWVKGKAFAMSPQGQGVGPVPQQKMGMDLNREIEASLSPAARPLWKRANLRYGGTMASIEPLAEPTGPFRGLNNRILYDRNFTSQWLDRNREELIRRMGPQAYDAYVERVLNGAQPGTRDIMPSGAGMPSDAFMQTFGRGTNSGSANLLGVPLRTALPGIGMQLTGRQPYTLPPALQQALDLVLQQRQMGASATP